MPRRYHRTSVGEGERFEVPLAQFPEGAGPALCIRARAGRWTRLGPSASARVPLDADGGGACAFGMTGGLAVVWAHLPAGEAGVGFVHHAPSGVVDPLLCSRALRELGCDLRDPNSRRRLFVVVASRQLVTPEDERRLLHVGILPENLFCYSACLLPEFGLSATGAAGELR